MRRRIAALATVSACLGLAGPLAGASRGDPLPLVQPGSRVKTVGVATCTAGFVFDGVGRLARRHYLALAAHCVEGEVGAVVTDAVGNRFGTVAFTMWPYTTFADDFAFVLLDRASYPRISPAMAGHPSMPTGVAAVGTTAPGDRVQVSGWGTLTTANATTREQRVSVLKDHDADFWSSWTVVSPGDSGGPVAHVPTGAALGSVSNLCVPLPVNHSGGFERVAGCAGYGPSVVGMIRRAAAKGFTVRVRTAAQGAPRS
ncbi:MAG TPA: hypothetical protein VNB94_08380 [Mycobacteriales bacterium]|nr:hypothetical protein [Mycobacteriales bacterium]